MSKKAKPHTLPTVPDVEVETDQGADESLLGMDGLLELAVKDEPDDDPLAREMRMAADAEKCRRWREASARFLVVVAVIGAVVGLYLKLFVL